MHALWVDVNGQISTAEDATVSALDLGFTRGDSVFETLRIYRGVPFMWRAHHQRLIESARAVGIPMPPTGELSARVDRLLDKGSGQDGVLRIQITAGLSERFAPMFDAIRPTVVIVLGAPPSQPAIDIRGRRAALSRIRRSDPQSLDPAIKSGSYLNCVLAARDVQGRGYEEAIMLGPDGTVTEAASANVFAWYQNAWHTPIHGIFPGITRAWVLELCTAHGISAHEETVSLAQLHEAEEIVLTSSVRELTPIIELDDRRVGSGKVGPHTRILDRHYQEMLAASDSTPSGSTTDQIASQSSGTKVR
ncbi:MAG: aminotransferase class IV [Myxococcota bacterium]